MPVRSARPKQFLDLRSHLPILGLDGAFEHGDRLSRLVEEILVKIPPRWFPGLGGEIPKERVGLCADDTGLREYRERDAVVHPAELRDLFVRPRLLAAEIVRRKSQHHKTFVAITA